MSTALQIKVVTVVGYVALAAALVVLLSDQGEMSGPATMVLARLP